MKLSLLCGVKKDSFFLEIAYFRISWVFGRPGDEEGGSGWGARMRWWIQGWCEKGEPKGEWLLGVNRDPS